MSYYFPVFEIPLFCFGIVLWVLCCHIAKKGRESEGWTPRPPDYPSVYVIPLFEEERLDEEVMDVYEAYFQPPYRDPPVYCSRNISLPPPYRLETPPYPDPPPSYSDPAASYTEPPAYSEQP